MTGKSFRWCNRLCGAAIIYKRKIFCEGSVFDRASRRPWPGAISRPAPIDAGYRLPAAPARQACGQWVKWVMPSKVAGLHPNRMRIGSMGQMGHDHWNRKSVLENGRKRGWGWGLWVIWVNGSPHFFWRHVLRAHRLRAIFLLLYIYTVF